MYLCSSVFLSYDVFLPIFFFFSFYFSTPCRFIFPFIFLLFSSPHAPEHEVSTAIASLGAIFFAFFPSPGVHTHMQVSIYTMLFSHIYHMVIPVLVCSFANPVKGGFDILRPLHFLYLPFTTQQLTSTYNPPLVLGYSG